jgi:halimadienyl-diphosphate synthase
LNVFIELLKLADQGYMPATAYDTAWIARLGDLDYEISNRALDWISGHQLADGSWGTNDLNNYYDRIICTLSAMIALTYRGRRVSDRRQIERGINALEAIADQAQNILKQNPNGATVGFELIVPTLILEAGRLNLISRNGNPILAQLEAKRTKKLAAMGGARISRSVTAAFSAEMAGEDHLDILDLANLREENGSVAHSPSATAYLARVTNSTDGLLTYLRKTLTEDGGAPNVAPFDVFERGWVLWNLALTSPQEEEILLACQPHLDFLERSWTRGAGIGWAAGYTPKDGDDTGLIAEVLARFGRNVDLDALYAYEEEEWFRCFAFEANPSISANIHLLSALRHTGHPVEHQAVQKILNFLRVNRTSAGFWEDKWHVSPYYASAHAVIACAGYASSLVQKTVDWMVASQREDGGWGLNQATAEETAYALQALIFWQNQSCGSHAETISRGYHWLAQHLEPPFPALWIGKCLYAPELVIRSAIHSALALN